MMEDSGESGKANRWVVGLAERVQVFAGCHVRGLGLNRDTVGDPQE